MMKYLSLFSGIGTAEKGIEQAYRQASERENSINSRKLRAEFAGDRPRRQFSNDNQHESAQPTSTDGEQGRKRNADIDRDGVCVTDDSAFRRNAECIGYAEIDKHAASIYRYHWSESRNYGDATNIVCGDLPDFDFLVAGFPCQSFSIAGKRLGFTETRGTLFFEIARILADKRPAHFLLENVRGLVSHDEGKTLPSILRILADLDYFVETTVLNSKDYGVPQNRERVFFIGHLAERCSREILSFGNGGRESFNESNGKGDNVAHTITNADKQRGSYVVTAGTLRTHKDGQGFRQMQDDISPSLNARARQDGSQQTVIQINPSVESGGKQPFQQNRIYADDGVAPALNRDLSTGAIAVASRGRPRDGVNEQQLEPRFDGLTNSLTSVEKDNLIAITESGTSQRNRVYDVEGIAPSIQSSEDRGGQMPAILTDRRIRRLTPIECERLQGLPDDFTKYGKLENGEVVEISDTQRYKVLGNAMTVDVIEAIVSRMLETECLQ